MKRDEKEGLIQGIQIIKAEPSFTHILFADNSLFFFRPNQKNIVLIQKIFNDYDVVSGQIIIKLDNSTITLGSKIFTHTRSAIQRILDIHKAGRDEKYLRLPEQ